MNLMGSNKSQYLNSVLVKELVIPYNVTSIGNFAFSGCSGLTSVTILDGVTYIGNDAFSYCKAITDVYYAGDEDQWDLINIRPDNDPIPMANIQFNFTEPYAKEQVTVGEPTVEERDGVLECAVTVFCPEEQTATAFGARYDADGRFLSLEQLQLKPGQDNELVIPFEDGSTIRIFAFDGASFSPLCAPAEASAS